MILDSNLYPPIFNQSYMPAFIYTDKCKVYFAISSYNTPSDFHSQYPVQVIVQNQQTNESVLNTTDYPSGIMLTTLQQDQTRLSDDKYYVQIKTEDIQGGFLLNQYYKVQIRFTGAQATDPPESAGIDGWLSENLNHFSEWSSVVLIYGISTPSLVLEDFDDEEQITTFPNYQVPIVGRLTFEEEQDKQYLRYYQIYLYNNNSQLVQDSGIIYMNSYQNINQLNYFLKYNMQENKDYNVKIVIVTNNLYSFQIEKTFRIEVEGRILDADLEITSNDNLGYIRLYLKNKYITKATQPNYEYSNGSSTLVAQSAVATLLGADTIGFGSVLYIPQDNLLVYYNGEDPNNDMSRGTKFIIRRTSSKDNFKKWQTLKTVVVQQDLILDFTIQDFTVEPGVWYKYEILRYNSIGYFTSYLRPEEPYMVVTEDIFLQADNKQLRIRFDPQVTNFSVKVSESLIETIGSKYPYIRRNGSIGYRTFNLSGTIMSFMNVPQDMFNASKLKIYQDSYQYYQNYNQVNKVSSFRDYIYEKEFRQKVMDFLYKNNVKLYRSLTQGNIAVKLMNISFTPNTTLGRLIYTFSCTAYEVMDATDNDRLKDYNVIDESYTYN